MKRLALIFVFVFLTSCASGTVNEDYFLTPHTLSVTFDDGKAVLSGTLEVAPEEMLFYPDTPKGLCIKISSDGGEVSYGSLKFGSEVVEMSRLCTLFEAIQEKKIKITFGNAPYPLSVEGEGFRLTVHEEITNK